MKEVNPYKRITKLESEVKELRRIIAKMTLALIIGGTLIELSGFF